METFDTLIPLSRKFNGKVARVTVLKETPNDNASVFEIDNFRTMNKIMGFRVWNELEKYTTEELTNVFMPLWHMHCVKAVMQLGKWIPRAPPRPPTFKTGCTFKTPFIAIWDKRRKTMTAVTLSPYGLYIMRRIATMNIEEQGAMWGRFAETVLNN